MANDIVGLILYFSVLSFTLKTSLLNFCVKAALRTVKTI
jgi:hypothetical protein